MKLQSCLTPLFLFFQARAAFVPEERALSEPYRFRGQFGGYHAPPDAVRPSSIGHVASEQPPSIGRATPEEPHSPKSNSHKPPSHSTGSASDGNDDDFPPPHGTDSASDDNEDDSLLSEAINAVYGGYRDILTKPSVTEPQEAPTVEESNKSEEDRLLRQFIEATSEYGISEADATREFKAYWDQYNRYAEGHKGLDNLRSESTRKEFDNLYGHYEYTNFLNRPVYSQWRQRPKVTKPLK